MLNAKYYRRQADICLTLALLVDDVTVANFLTSKAHQFLADAAHADMNPDRDAPATSMIGCVIGHDKAGDDTIRDHSPD